MHLEKSILKKSHPIPAELNFLKYPLFFLDHQDKSVQNRLNLEYRPTPEAVWKVIPSTEYGLPTDFDRKVFRFVEKIVSEADWPIKNPIQLPSLREICEGIGITSSSGKNLSMVKESLLRLKTLNIRVKGTFESKEDKNATRVKIDTTISIYQQVTFIGEHDPSNGNQLSERNIVHLSDWYLKNINAYNYRLLDYHFWQELDHPTAQRLYEYLGGKFYGTLKRGKEQPYRLVYAEYCAIAPMTYHTAPSRRKAQLQKAIDILKAKGYLTDALPTNSTWDEVLFYPGNRVIAELKLLQRKWAERGVPLSLEEGNESATETATTQTTLPLETTVTVRKGS